MYRLLCGVETRWLDSQGVLIFFLSHWSSSLIINSPWNGSSIGWRWKIPAWWAGRHLNEPTEQPNHMKSSERDFIKPSLQLSLVATAIFISLPERELKSVAYSEVSPVLITHSSLLCLFLSLLYHFRKNETWNWIAQTDTEKSWGE